MEIMDIKNKNGRVEIKQDDIKDSVSYSPIKKDDSKLVLNFVRDNVKYYFKANSRYSYDQNEVLASILLTNNGIDTNRPEFALFVSKERTYEGIISKDMFEDRKNTEIINYEQIYDIYAEIDTCVDFIFNRLKFYCEDYNLKLDPNMYDDLSVRSLVYYMTGQQDFSHRNIEFKITKSENGEKVLSLLPIVDNSITFFAIIDEIKNNTFNKITLKQVKEQPKAYTQSLIYGLMFETDKFDLYSHNRIVRELALNILKNKKLETIFRNFVKFDFKKAIKEYIKTNPNFIFNPESVQKAIILFENNREDLVNMVKTIRNNFFNENSKNFNAERQFE